MADKFKPVGYSPAGWTFHKTFVDDELNVFHRGVHAPDEKGTIEQTTRAKDLEKTSKKQEALKQDNPLDAQNQQAQLFEDLGITPELLQGLIEKSKEQDKLIEEMKVAMSQSSPATGEGERIKEMASAIAQAERYKKGDHFYHDIKELDPLDHDTKGATFTSYGNGYFIVDDVRNGNAVRTPYGRIFQFRFQASRITRVGREENYSSFCTFVTHSKKEIKWLRDHSRYGLEFYEDTHAALSASARKIQIAAGIHAQVSRLSMNQILQRAKQMEIPIGGDLSVIKSALSVKMAEAEIAKADREAEVRNQDAFESKFA